MRFLVSPRTLGDDIMKLNNLNSMRNDWNKELNSLRAQINKEVREKCFEAMERAKKIRGGDE